MVRDVSLRDREREKIFQMLGSRSGEAMDAVSEDRDADKRAMRKVRRETGMARVAR